MKLLDELFDLRPAITVVLALVARKIKASMCPPRSILVELGKGDVSKRFPAGWYSSKLVTSSLLRTWSLGTERDSREAIELVDWVLCSNRLLIESEGRFREGDEVFEWEESSLWVAKGADEFLYRNMSDVNEVWWSSSSSLSSITRKFGLRSLAPKIVSFSIISVKRDPLGPWIVSTFSLAKLIKLNYCLIMSHRSFHHMEWSLKALTC